MKMKPGCGDMGGMKGQEVGSCQRRCPLCPCFQVGSGQGLNHLQLPAGAPRTAGCPGLEHLFLAVGKGCSRTTGGSPSDARGDGGQRGLACRLRRDRVGQPPPPGVGSPQRAASPRLLLSLLAVLAWCRAHACLDLFLRGAGCLLGDSLAAMPCWQWGAGGLCPHHPSLGFLLSGYPRSCSDISPSQQISSFPTCPCSESGWCCERGGWSGGCRGFGQDGC